MGPKIDLDTINRILKNHKNSKDDWLQDMELDEDQKSYVSGYMDCMEEEQKKEVTEEVMQDQINNVRSKYCEPIINALEEEGNLYHGDLADKIGLSPSGLNAIIKKMQESSISLIQTNQIGKYKIYSLSEEMKACRSKKRHFLFEEPLQITKGEGALFLLLQRFVEEAGEQWKEILGVILQGGEDAYPIEVINCFEKFIEQMVDITIQKSESLEKIKKFLGNDVLLYLLNDYIDAKIRYDVCLDNLVGQDNRLRDLKLIKQALRKMEH